MLIGVLALLALPGSGMAEEPAAAVSIFNSYYRCD
jgi:hypothetical protein